MRPVIQFLASRVVAPHHENSPHGDIERRFRLPPEVDMRCHRAIEQLWWGLPAKAFPPRYFGWIGHVVTRTC